MNGGGGVAGEWLVLGLFAAFMIMLAAIAAAVIIECVRIAVRAARRIRRER